MATIDQILGTGKTAIPKLTPVAPPPVDSSLSGAANSVGSSVVAPSAKNGTEGDGSQPKATPEPQKSVTPNPPSSLSINTDATRIVGEAGKDVMPSGAGRPGLSYVQMYDLLAPKPETEEERVKREKREKREAIFSAIGDGISALSNLYFTTQYAPNAYNPSQSMSAKARERWDRLRAERDAKRRAYNEGYLKVVMMDDAKGREDRSWRHTLERERILDKRADAAQERAERKAEQDEQMFQAKLALQYGKLTEQGYRNRIAEIKAGKAAELTDAEIRRLNRVGTGKSGGGRPGEYPWYDRDGNLHYAHSYEAMRQNAELHGTFDERTQTSSQTKTQTSGRKTTTTTTNTTKPAKGTSKKPERTKKTGITNWK